jgi:LmbE family N-acetylglucosaminyl deacetylase
MISLSASPPRPYRILCLGAHSDDIEIGCGGTILHLLETVGPCPVHWVVFSAAGDRAREARASAELFLDKASESHVMVHGFKDGYFPYQGAAVKDAFETLKVEVDPDVIFTHCRHDLHQDHKMLSQLALNTYRDHLILEYEIPKYDGDLRTPNVYVPLSERARARKLEILTNVFGSQRSKRWFTTETFDGLMRLRGVESASPSGYAEGFHAHKMRAFA